MGKDLFRSDLYPRSLEQEVDAILGYSLRDMCLKGTDEQLRKTEITQPCLFIVNALHYMKDREEGKEATYLAGHSLGEYNALLAAGVFDITTGLRLVQQRGKLMASAPKGSMAAVLGIDADSVASALEHNALTSMDIANFNTPKQVVISGLEEDILRAEEVMMSAGATGYILLNVSAAFHSRYMKATAQEYAKFVNEIEFDSLNAQIISNVTAKPYPMEGGDSIRELLVKQIESQVLWSPSIGYIKAMGVDDFIESGPGVTLTNMLKNIPALSIKKQQKKTTNSQHAKQNDSEQFSSLSKGSTDDGRDKNLVNEKPDEATQLLEPDSKSLPINEPQVEKITKAATSEVPLAFSINPEALGSDSFKSDYGVRYAYIAGAMYKGIASKDMVIAMGKQRLLSYLGTGGLMLNEIEDAIRSIKEALPVGPYGMNLLHHPNDLEAEEQMVDCYLRHGIKNVEAAAYMSITPAIARFRLTGLESGNNGKCIRKHRVLAKVSRPEVASLFMRPAPDYIIRSLVEAGKITQIQAELARTVPMADDICVEADSGGHTDGGVAITLFPAILLLRDEIVGEYVDTPCIRVGAAGGIGTPHSAAAAFIMGADFILTGSMNQCTVEAGTSDSVKNLLEKIEAQDTAYAPAGDMFEYGAKIQVVRKGLFFHTRANMLYDLYTRYNSLEEIPQVTTKKIEEKFFNKKLIDVWAETKSFFESTGRNDMTEIESNPKKKMALIFKWYFFYSNRLALEGCEDQQVNYQIQCGPALGAFNRWVKGTEFESWRNRPVADVAELLMQGTAKFLSSRISGYQ
jgi:trans-AT polyketide synthase/acyltransferase/oxidoreductase domain-containing protein